MLIMVFIKVKENNNIVDKNTTITTILFQRSIYKTLHVRKGVCIAYKTDIRTLHSSLTNENKAVLIVGIHYKLEKEVCYINDREIFLSSNRIDDLLL